MNENLREQYQREGYAIIRSAFNSEEIRQLRSAAVDVFSRPVEYEGDRKNIKFDILARYPAFRTIIRNSNFVHGLKRIFGENMVVFPEDGLHDSGVSGGWHRDTGTQEKHGCTFQWEPDFNLANVAIYLQDNHPDYAGGLDVVPRSQNSRSTWWDNQKSANPRVKYVLSHLDRRGLLPKWVLHKKKGAISVPTKAGDVLVFNMNLVHRPTHPKVKPVPNEFRKLAYFIIAGEKNRHAANYLNYIKTRPDYLYLKNYRYPEDLLDAARKSGAELFWC